MKSLNKNLKKCFAITQIVIMITFSLFFSLSLSSQEVQAAQVCCEKTRGENPRFCETVDETECDPLSQRAPTSCDQTSFCKTGCCAASDGFCYSNYPQALCEKSPQINGDYTPGQCADVSQCKLGCCLIGTQALFTTKSNCIAQTGGYGDLEVDFRTSVENEQACLDLAKSADTGCCVTQEGCKFTSKAECNVAQTINGTGFYKDKYCSSLPNQCECTPSNPEIIGANNRPGNRDERQTTCLSNDDSVYWKDSCGNPEGIKEKCDYSQGTLCGDLDKDGIKTCESTSCTPSDNKIFTFSNTVTGKEGKISPQLLERSTSGTKNGESWCLWDYTADEAAKQFFGKDPVGAIHYRSLCINGQELVEPCADFRKEFCFSTDVIAPGVTPTSEDEFVSGRCLKNDQWSSCIDDCNTADPFSMDKKEYEKALEKDVKCCSDISKRDCQWAGKCVPAVKPGFKFWEAEGADTCSKADTQCTATFACPGWDSKLGICGADDGGWRAFKRYVGVVGAGAAAGAVAGGGIGALGGALAAGIQVAISEQTAEEGWVLVSGGECFSKDYLQASNNYCRSMGDCGADINIDNKLTMEGFSNTETINEEFEDKLVEEGSSYISDKIEKVSKAIGRDIDSKEVIDGLDYIDDLKNAQVEEIPGKLEIPDWKKGQMFFNFSIKNQDLATYGQTFFGQDEWDSIAGLRVGATYLTIPTLSGLLALAGSSAIGSGQLFISGLLGTMPPLNLISTGLGVAGKEGAKQYLQTAVDEGAYKATVESSAVYQNAVSDAKFNILKRGFEKGGVSLSREGSVYVLTEGTGTPTIITRYESIDKLLATQEEATAQVYKKALDKAEEGVANNLASSTLPNFLAGASAGSWVFLGYKILDTIMTETKTVTVSTTCSPWQAPPVTEEDQCERCNPTYKDYINSENDPITLAGFKKCTEYRCKS